MGVLSNIWWIKISEYGEQKKYLDNDKDEYWRIYPS